MSDKDKKSLAGTNGAGSLSELINRGAVTAFDAFGREIFLIKVHVAGTTHVRNIRDIEPTLNVGDKVNFVRDPENPYDEKAIAMFEKGGRRIGFVPRSQNEILAALMDAGKLIYAEVADKEFVDDWLKITVKVYMHD